MDGLLSAGSGEEIDGETPLDPSGVWEHMSDDTEGAWTRMGDARDASPPDPEERMDGVAQADIAAGQCRDFVLSNSVLAL